MKTYFQRLFAGRINRKNWVIGISLLVSINFSLLMILITLDSLIQAFRQSAMGNFVYFAAAALYVIIFFTFLLSFNTRRLHDVGLSGWGGGIDLIGEGDKNQNKYGKPPLPDTNLKSLFGF